MSFRGLSVCVVAAALAAAACGSGGSGGEGGTRRLSIATGGTGGVFYPYGGGIARVLSEHLPNTQVTAEVTAASVDNLKFIKQGNSDLGFTMADIAADAAAGRDAFRDIGPVPTRVIAVLYPSYTHLVTLTSSGIRSVADLRGRVVSTGSPGAGTTVMAERILAAAGLDPVKDIRAHNLGVAQSADALKDGKVDAFFWNGGLPTAAILDLVNTPGITARLIPLDGLLPTMEKKFGNGLYFRIVIPTAAYHLPDDVPVIGVENLLVVSETMPEPLAHDITKILFEQQPTLASIHPQAQELSIEKGSAATSIPFHPGAIRYYRERGVWKQ